VGGAHVFGEAVREVHDPAIGRELRRPCYLADDDVDVSPTTLKLGTYLVEVLGAYWGQSAVAYPDLTLVLAVKSLYLVLEGTSLIGPAGKG